jgi:hypothetical protein
MEIVTMGLTPKNVSLLVLGNTVCFIELTTM